MVDVSGIPNMGFGGGGYLGGIPNQQPALSAAQINASMGWNPNAVQFDPFANTPGGFGGQTAAYAGAGAAYGRQTGYYGDTLGLPPGQTTPAAQAGGDVWSQGAPGYNDYGGAADINWMLGGSQGQRPSEAYNAPRQYGWNANEGAAVPQQQAPEWPMGQFRPQTYGWEHNEGGVNGFGGAADVQWMLGGSIGPRPSDSWSQGAPSSGVVAGWYDAYGGGGGYPQEQAHVPSAQIGSQDWQTTFNNMTGGNSSNAYYLGGSPWYPGGGGDDPRDVQWMLGGSQGPRPSTSGGGSGYDIGGQSRSLQSPLQGFDWAQSYMPNYSTGGAMSQALLASQYQPFNTFGGAEDVQWMLGGSQGERPSSRGGGGANYNPWAQMSQSPMPSGQFGGENTNTYGYPGSGYLGATGIYQDPFGGYVPGGAVGPEGLGGNYRPRYDAFPGFQGGA
jgi:hypothetical protein